MNVKRFKELVERVAFEEGLNPDDLLVKTMQDESAYRQFAEFLPRVATATHVVASPTAKASTTRARLERELSAARAEATQATSPAAKKVAQTRVDELKKALRALDTGKTARSFVDDEDSAYAAWRRLSGVEDEVA